MKFTSEHGIEMEPGFYWGRSIERHLFNSEIREIKPCVVHVFGTAPFLEFDIVGGLSLASECELVERLEPPILCSVTQERPAT